MGRRCQQLRLGANPCGSGVAQAMRQFCGITCVRTNTRVIGLQAAAGSRCPESAFTIAERAFIWAEAQYRRDAASRSGARGRRPRVCGGRASSGGNPGARNCRPATRSHGAACDTGVRPSASRRVQAEQPASGPSNDLNPIKLSRRAATKHRVEGVALDRPIAFARDPTGRSARCFRAARRPSAHDQGLIHFALSRRNRFKMR